MTIIPNKQTDRKQRFPSEEACEDNAMEVKEAMLRNAIDVAGSVEAAKDDNPDINQSEQSAYRDPLAHG